MIDIHDGRQAGAPTPAERFAHYRKVVSRRWPLMAAIIALTILAALAMSMRSPKEYQATSKVLLGTDSVSSLLPGSGGSPQVDLERDANTNLALIKIETVAEGVRRRLGLDEPVGALTGEVETAVNNNSNIVSIIATDRSPARAAEIANAFAAEYQAFRQRAAQASVDDAVALARQRLDALGPTGADTALGRDLTERVRELQIAAALQTGGVQVVHRASPASAASTSGPLFGLIVAAFLGTLLACAVALVLDRLDTTIRDEEDAETAFRVPVLASVPRRTHSRLAIGPARGVVGEEAVREAYAALATRLSVGFLRSGRGALLVTSADESDAKTNVTLGLARAFVDLGRTVLAIDANLRNPQFGPHLELGALDRGLSTVLAGGGKLEKEIREVEARPGEHRAGAGQLLALSCGPVPANPHALLNSAAMVEELAVARACADVVIIDAAPLLVSDVLPLVGLADGTLAAARAGLTSADAARRAMRALRSVDGRMLGVVLTEARVRSEPYPVASAPPAIELPERLSETGKVAHLQTNGRRNGGGD